MSSPSKENLPKVADEIQQELFSFKASNLKHAETQEKVTLPSKEDVQQEKMHNSLLEGVEQFEKTSMKHVQTQENVCLPKKEDIESEKEHKQMIEGIETFDPSKLKHAETLEKNPLPTKEVIAQEKAAAPDVALFIGEADMNSLDSNRCFTLEHALAEPEFEEPASDGEEDSGPDVNLNRRVKSRSSYARLEVQSMGIDLTRDPALEPDRDNNLEMEQPLLRVACNNRSNLASGGGANKGFLDYCRMLETAVRQREAHQGPTVHAGRQWSSEKSETESLLPAAADPAPALPEGWERHLDDDGPYYWHIRTGTIQREPPVLSPLTEGPPASPAPSPPAPEVLAPAQVEAKRQNHPPAPAGSTSERPVPVRFAVRSLGWSEIPEEELSPERSSRAVNRCIVDLSLGRGRALPDGVGRWGEGRDLLLELDQDQLRLLGPQGEEPLHVQPLHAIRVWGVGRDNGR
ncbi:hypothetical protein HPB47_027915 [Ixodes persulcatus]|uniref:Uncharacterized protein n=1 Tax=Ixodes persulcatus TaxID=34615 RepID=A0AC60PV69_IXOPE|nr:hypothetical protein HPB47_027915 [Ixodes persulcatus]